MANGMEVLIKAPIRLLLLCLVAATLLVLLWLLVVGAGHGGVAHADHNDMYVVCPSPIGEGDTAHMQVRWPGYAGIGVTIFTYHGSYTASGNDFVGYDGVKFKGESDDDSVWVPVVTNEDDNPEHDETFKIGFWVTGQWHGCVVEIADDDAPWIKYAEVSSRPVKDDKYRAGENIDVTLAFDREVEVSGSPLVSIYLGDEDVQSDETRRGAQYHSGSGTRYLTFRYAVEAADRDDDGLSVGAGEMDSDGNPTSGFSGAGAIYANGTDVPIDYTHRGVPQSSDHKVDGRPYVRSTSITSAPPAEWDAYTANQVIELTMQFSAKVEVETPVSAGVYVGYDGANAGEALRQASYLRGSGTEALVFGYTVQPGDMDAEGIMVEPGTENSGIRGSGSIKAAGTDVGHHPDYDGSGHLEAHVIDTEPPFVYTIAFGSSPSNGEAYGVGEAVEVELTFNEPVTLSGELSLELDVGGQVRLATLHSDIDPDAGESEQALTGPLVFRYSVEEGDADPDGIGISANSLVLEGGRIRDTAGNAGSLSHDAVAADPGQKVDTSQQD